MEDEDKAQQNSDEFRKAQDLVVEQLNLKPQLVSISKICKGKATSFFNILSALKDIKISLNWLQSAEYLPLIFPGQTFKASQWNGLRIPHIHMLSLILYFTFLPLKSTWFSPWGKNNVSTSCQVCQFSIETCLGQNTVFHRLHSCFIGLSSINCQK